MHSTSSKHATSPPSPHSRPSKRTRQHVSESEEGLDSGAPGGSEDAEHGIPRKDTISDTKDRVEYATSSSMSASQSLTFDASEVETAIEDDLPGDPSDPGSWSVGQLQRLLAGFVEGSKGVLDAKYSAIKGAKGMLETHPELRDILVNAWNKKDYDRVLSLDILRPESTLTPNSSGLTEDEKERLLSGFSAPYQGIAVDAFYEYLELSHRYYLDEDRKYYAKFCSVVQSSGTGKTRTILELAGKGVLLLYMNLRPKADNSGSPDRDDTPASILTGDCKSKNEYFIQCCAFFSAIFKLIRDDLLARLPTDKGVAVENWNKDMWFKTSYRDSFFERLQSTYDRIRNGFVLKKYADKKSGNSNTNGNANLELGEYYKELTKVLASAFPNTGIHQPKLVIALDEAHSLHEEVGFSRSTVLFRVIKAYSAPRSSHAVWVVFASTTSKVADFASPQTLFNSARVSIEGELIFPPFCQLRWDQHAPSLKDVLPTEVAKVNNILRYGRPLWGTMLPNFEATFDLASNKLIGKPLYEASNDQVALVVLAQRFGLDVCFGHREAARFVSSTVASHMRVIVTTTEDRLWSYTAYPSEPILSCAAAILMHKNTNSLEDTLRTLKRKVDNGMIDVGQCGELVSRLIWLLAKDFYVICYLNTDTQRFTGSGDDTELVHCRMIPVIAFIEFVFGDHFWEKVKDHAGSDAKEAFQDAYINFSHWVSMESYVRQDESEDQLDLNEWTMRHWHRTCAVQCCHSQPAIDKVIPIYFKSADPKGVNRMSQILISDKARTSKQRDALSEIQRSDPTIGGPEDQNALPYIAIVADLHLEETGLESVTFPTRASARTTNDSRCLRIRACGLGEKSYPFFKHCPNVLEVLKSLLEREMTPPKSNQPRAAYLQDQVKYGNSGEGRHMEWERGSMLLESLPSKWLES